MGNEVRPCKGRFPSALLPREGSLPGAVAIMVSHWQRIVEVTGIGQESASDLPQIAQTVTPPSVLKNANNSWSKQQAQQHKNGEDYNQFGQRES